jgi:hypothetical protein
MLARVTSSEIIEIEAEYAARPWGETREDLRAGMLGSAICNSWGGSLKPGDFLMEFGEAEEMTMEEAQMQLDALAGTVTAQFVDGQG